MEALIRAARDGRIAGTPALVVSTTPAAPALEIAEGLGVCTQVIRAEGAGQAGLDRALAAAFLSRKVHTVCLAGYMRLLGPEFLAQFPARILNIHPSLLPLFGGQGYYGRRVHQAVIDSGARVSGATVHLVDSDYDQGPIVLQGVTSVEDDDTAETLAARVLQVEHRIYPEALGLLLDGRLRVEGRRVRHLQASFGQEPALY